MEQNKFTIVVGTTISLHEKQTLEVTADSYDKALELVMGMYLDGSKSDGIKVLSDSLDLSTREVAGNTLYIKNETDGSDQELSLDAESDERFTRQYTLTELADELDKVVEEGKGRGMFYKNVRTGQISYIEHSNNNGDTFELSSFNCVYLINPYYDNLINKKVCRRREEDIARYLDANMNGKISAEVVAMQEGIERRGDDWYFAFIVEEDGRYTAKREVDTFDAEKIVCLETRIFAHSDGSLAETINRYLDGRLYNICSVEADGYNFYQYKEEIEGVLSDEFADDLYTIVSIN